MKTLRYDEAVPTFHRISTEQKQGYRGERSRLAMRNYLHKVMSQREKWEGLMPDKLFKLHCAYCSGETKIIIEAPATRGKKRKTIQITRYCEFCNKPNLITVPESWDERNPILDDRGFLGYSEGIPILQGEQPK